MLVAVWCWLWAALAADCPAPVGIDALVEAMDRTEAALVDLDDLAFRDGINELAGLLMPCADGVVPRDVAARYHRLMALHLHALGDEDNARLAVRAARTLAPDQPWSPELVPDTHPLAEMWAASEPDEDTRTVPEPRYGALAFDGEVGRARPRDLPTVAQVFDPSGIPVSTRYLAPREPLPPYTAIPRQRNLLLGCTGGALALSGAAWGAGWSARANMVRTAADPAAPADAIEAARASANTMSVLSGALFGVAAGCGTGAALIGQR